MNNRSLFPIIVTDKQWINAVYNNYVQNLSEQEVLDICNRRNISEFCLKHQSQFNLEAQLLSNNKIEIKGKDTDMDFYAISFTVTIVLTAEMKKTAQSQDIVKDIISKAQFDYASDIYQKRISAEIAKQIEAIRFDLFGSKTDGTFTTRSNADR